MSDDLVKRLRQPWDANRSIVSQTGRWMVERKEAADRIEELETKLAKAVEVIKAAAREHRVIAGMDMVGASSTAYNAAREAEATLAELTGGKDE